MNACTRVQVSVCTHVHIWGDTPPLCKNARANRDSAVLNRKKCSVAQFSQKSLWALHVFNHGGGWQLAVGGDWRLAVGNWRLVVVGGGWWLVIGGWWRLVVVGGWRRLVAVGGSWRLAVGGPLGRSLTKKNLVP